MITRCRKPYRFDKDWQDDESLHISTGLLLNIQAGTKIASPLAIQSGHKYQHQVHCWKQCICVGNAGRGIRGRSERGGVNKDFLEDEQNEEPTQT